jgi:hypothetical protein
MNEREALEMVEKHASRCHVLVAGDDEARLRRFWRCLQPHQRRVVDTASRPYEAQGHSGEVVILGEVSGELAETIDIVQTTWSNLRAAPNFDDAPTPQEIADVEAETPYEGMHCPTVEPER